MTGNSGQCGPDDGREALTDALLADPRSVDELPDLLPAETGLYAWWAPPSILPDLVGVPHPNIAGLRLLYVGIATNLRTRIRQNHLRRSGSSTLRRTLAGLMLDDEGYRTRWTTRVVLVEEDELRLTAWMSEHLRVSWCVDPNPRSHEPAIITSLKPPLNVDHTTGPTRDVIKAARRRYRDSVGHASSDQVQAGAPHTAG